MTRKSKEETRKRVFFLTPFEWSILLPVTVVSGFISAAFTWDISPWISVAVFLTVATAGHLALAAKGLLALPHIAIMIAALQYVLAAWLAYYWPPTNPTYDVGVYLERYLGYAGPALCLSVVGWIIALFALKYRAIPKVEASSSVLLELDGLALIGLVALACKNFIEIEGLGFAMLLLSNLRYVGVYGRMLVGGGGWLWRLMLMLVVEMLFAAGAGMFHDLLAWILWSFAMWVYAKAPRPSVVLASLVLALLLLPALQESKWRLREGPVLDDPWAEYEAEKLSDDPFTRATHWVRYLASGLFETVTLNIDPQFLSDIAVRYNQGWIVNRIMSYVPESEPYAEGETIKDAAINATVPRIILPSKGIAGGQYLMARYAGMYLGETTSMNVGYAGEMYLNFGPEGGAIGCGMYTLALGLLFRLLLYLARKRPLLLAFVPFIFYSAARAEDDIGFVLNWTIKAIWVAIGIAVIFPGFRRGLPARSHSDIPLDSEGAPAF